jgi:hypothetical protein
MQLTAPQARNIFDAVVGMNGPTQALFEASQQGHLSDEELITVVTDYYKAKQHLDNMLLTHGVISPSGEGWPQRKH